MTTSSLPAEYQTVDPRTDQALTYRPTVPAMERRMFQPVPVLDHGFVSLVDYMGDDNSIVQAARVSYGRGTKQRSTSRGLIRYLVRNRHTTPLEMCEVKLHVKLPIFIARQWIRHRTASVNEISGRYSVLDREFYIPAPRALAPQSKTNKQGRAVEILGEEEAAQVLQILRADAERNYDDYLTLLNEDEKGEKLDPTRDGLTRELARINLTLGHYTQWYWKIDLHNLLHFLGLRLDSHAQYEIRAYCQVIATMVQEWVPDVWEAFTDYRLEGRSFSRQEMQALRTQLRGYPVDFAALGMADSEIAEYHKKLGL